MSYVIAYPGTAGSFSHGAAQDAFPGCTCVGYATFPEAAQAVLERAFLELGANAVWCCRYDGNERSRRVQEKLGFVYHHTTHGLTVAALNEKRTGHVMLLTRQTWEKNRG